MQSLVWRSERTRPYGRQRRSLEDNIKMGHQEIGLGYGSRLGYKQVLGCCEHSNEPSGCIKCEDFYDWLNNC